MNAELEALYATAFFSLAAFFGPPVAVAFVWKGMVLAARGCATIRRRRLAGFVKLAFGGASVLFGLVILWWYYVTYGPLLIPAAAASR